jgi:hypothetical protein
MPQELKLRCYAQRTHEGWWAICTTLDIAVDGHTLKEARAGLRAAVQDYLDYVLELPVGERERFLHRSAPWPLRAKLWLLVVLSTIFHRHDGKHHGGGRRAIEFSACRAFG